MSQKKMERNAHSIASNKYNEKAYWRFVVNIKKKSEAAVKNRCAELGGITPSQYVNFLIEKDIEGFDSVGEATKKGDKRK